MDYKGNSHRSKAEGTAVSTEQKRVEKVVKGTVKTKKKNEIHKFKDVFISEDASNVKSYIFMDVLVPAIKKAVCDIVVDGINMILFGESGRSKKTSSGAKVSYRSYYDKDDRRYDRPRTRTSFDIEEDIIFETRGDAEAVLDQMDALIDTYKVVRVADLYDMADRSTPHTAYGYGWTNVSRAEVIRTRDGYVIKLPRPMAID